MLTPAASNDNSKCSICRMLMRTDWSQSHWSHGEHYSRSHMAPRSPMVWCVTFLKWLKGSFKIWALWGEHWVLTDNQVKSCQITLYSLVKMTHNKLLSGRYFACSAVKGNVYLMLLCVCAAVILCHWLSFLGVCLWVCVWVHTMGSQHTGPLHVVRKVKGY